MALAAAEAAVWVHTAASGVSSGKRSVGPSGKRASCLQHHALSVLHEDSVLTIGMDMKVMFLLSTVIAAVIVSCTIALLIFRFVATQAF